MEGGKAIGKKGEMWGLGACGFSGRFCQRDCSTAENARIGETVPS